MRNSLLALGLVAGLATAQAAVLVTQGGPSQSLFPASGLATGGVDWAAPATVTIAGLIVQPVANAWVATGGTIVAPLTAATGGGGLSWADGVAIPPLVADNSTQYYLVFGTGGVVGGLVSGMSHVEGTTDPFVLVPEPGAYVLLAGLGLIGFAGYRRLSR